MTINGYYIPPRLEFLQDYPDNYRDYFNATRRDFYCVTPVKVGKNYIPCGKCFYCRSKKEVEK